MASSEVSEVSEVFTAFTADDLHSVDNLGMPGDVECAEVIANHGPGHDHEDDDHVLYGHAKDSLLDDSAVPLPPVSPFLISSHDTPTTAPQLATSARQRKRPTPTKAKKVSKAVANPEISLSDVALVGKVGSNPVISGQSLGGSANSGWQQQQVSIKTLEGEFSVTMWASGAEDEGRNRRMYP